MKLEIRAFRTALLAGCAVAALLQATSLRADEPDQGAPAGDQAKPAKVTDFGEIVVESNLLRAKLQAIQDKRDAPNFKDILPAEEIRRLPDVSVAEALERLPGVSLESDSGQGRFVNIRGMDTDLNGSYFDGVHLTANNNNASPMGGGRGVAFDVFPAGLVGGVEVVKTLTPEMDAEGVGGQVNMLSHPLVIGGKPFAEAEFGGGYEALRGSPAWVYNVTAGASFGLTPGHGLLDPTAPEPVNDGSRPFRLIVNYSHDEDHRGIDDVEEDYSSPTGGKFLPLSDLQNRWYEYHRVRDGETIEADYDPSPDTGLYLKGMQSGYWESATKHEMLTQNLDSNFTDNGSGSFSSIGAVATQRFIDTAEHIQSSLITAGGHFMLGNLVRVDLKGGWTKGIDQFTHAYTIDFASNNPFNLTYSVADPARRTVTIATPGINLADPSQFSLKRVRNSPSYAYDQEYSSFIDFSAPLTLGGIAIEAKAGAAVRLRDRGVDNSEYDSVLAGKPSLANFVTGANQIYYNGYYNIGPDIHHEPAIGAVAGYAANADAALGAFARDTENVYAGYGQLTGNLGPISVTGGVRVEATEDKQLANLNNADTDSWTPNTTQENYTNFFPSIQGKYQPLPSLQLRAAFSTGIARPGFNQISASTSVSFSNATVSQGNPNLKPMTANSVDLGADYDLPGGGNAAVGLFYKSFDNYIVTTQYLGSYKGEPDFRFSSYQNINNSQAQGVEVTLFRPFTFLPKPWDGFGLDANYTYVDSSTTLRPGDKKEVMPQTSPENFNVGFFYDKRPINVRIGASYVSTSLWAIGGDRNGDIFSQARFRLDFGSAYQLTDTMQLYFNVKNLTNTKLEFTQGMSSANPIQREFYDETYYGGLRVKI